jgi:hypothetical protein
VPPIACSSLLPAFSQESADDSGFGTLIIRASARGIYSSPAAASTVERKILEPQAA